MKSMEEYINDVYTKYEETQSKQIKYKTVRMKYHSPLTTLCGVATCMVLICAICVGVKFVKPVEKISHEYVSSELNTNGNIIYTAFIEYDNNRPDRIEQLILNSTDIAIVSFEKISNVFHKYDGRR